MVLQQGYTEDYEQPQGKGSFPAMITPAYQRAKTANQLASQVRVLGSFVPLMMLALDMNVAIPAIQEIQKNVLEGCGETTFSL